MDALTGPCGGLDFPALFQIQQDALQERPELLLFFRGKHGKQPLFHVRLGEERLAGHLQPLRGQFHKDVPTVLPIRIAPDQPLFLKVIHDVGDRPRSPVGLFRDVFRIERIPRQYIPNRLLRELRLRFVSL